MIIWITQSNVDTEKTKSNILPVHAGPYIVGEGGGTVKFPLAGKLTVFFFFLENIGLTVKCSHWLPWLIFPRREGITAFPVEVNSLFVICSLSK